MPVLMIGATEREQVAKLIAYAKANPVLFDVVRATAVDREPVLELQDRKPGAARPPSHNIIFPGGFRAAFSIEQQPPGLCTHLSISVEGRTKKGMMPAEAAVQMICEEFGVPYPANKMWIEEFDPGEYAINLVSLYAPMPGGTA